MALPYRASVAGKVVGIILNRAIITVCLWLWGSQHLTHLSLTRVGRFSLQKGLHRAEKTLCFVHEVRLFAAVRGLIGIRRR
jgi:hypothetical protein